MEIDVEVFKYHGIEQFLCVLCRVGQQATVEEIEFRWGTDNKSKENDVKLSIQFTKLKEFGEINFATYGPYPFNNEELSVMCDEDAGVDGTALNRIGYFGTFIVVARGKAGPIPLSQSQADRVVSQLNDRMLLQQYHDQWVIYMSQFPIIGEDKTVKSSREKRITDAGLKVGELIGIPLMPQEGS